MRRFKSQAQLTRLRRNAGRAQARYAMIENAWQSFDLGLERYSWLILFEVFCPDA